MDTQFAGAAKPLDQAGLDAALGLLGTGAAELWSVLTVETAGCGFDRYRRPRILFERHKFSTETGGRYDKDYPDISNPQAGGYGDPDTQYQRLAAAVALERKAALHSASWGIAQIMGFNAAAAGYADVEGMVAAMQESEAAQLLAMAHFLKSSRLDDALRRRDWAGFAAGYNGPGYARNQYDTRLAAAYQGLSGRLPDLQVRTVQMLLTFLGYKPGPIDGFAGAATVGALTAFYQCERIAPRDQIDEAAAAALTRAVQREAAPA